MKHQIIIDSIDKKQYPDEVVDGIIARMQEFAERVPVSMFAGLTGEQIRGYWQNAQSFMLLGADVALDYMDKKMQENEHS